MCLIVQVTGSQCWSLDLLSVCRLNLRHRKAVRICCSILCTLECGFIKEAAAGVYCTAVLLLQSISQSKGFCGPGEIRALLCCADSLVLYVFVLYFPSVLSLTNSIIKKCYIYKWVTNADVCSEATRQNLVTIVTITLTIIIILIIIWK